MNKHHNLSHYYSLLLSLFMVFTGVYSSLGQITRTQIINNAMPYSTYTFTSTSSNIWSNVTCSPVGTVNTPSWVVVGSNISMPYCWGGFSTLTSFTSGLTSGKSAGDDNTSTSGDGSESCALGVDCSGFVSRAWALSTKYSTSTLPNISTQYSSPTQVQPGDIFDYAGSHVRLVKTNNGNGNYTIIESSANGWDVAIHSYTTANLTSYTPRYYVNVINTPVDTISPATLISVSGNWQTQNFTANFTDVDNTGGSGINTRFYQVLDYNGTEWRANNNKGFFNDNFNTAINGDWLTADSLGVWNVSNGHLNQTYTGSNKTRLPVPVTQDSTHIWLYHWQMSFNTGSTRRAGIYIMASDPTQSYLGNAYLIWLRADDDICEIYTVKSNTISGILATAACTINDNTFYDYKVIYDPATGVISVFQNDIIICSYTDAQPLKTAGYISLRTGSASVMYDDIKVYKSRGPSALVSVGAAATNDIRFQNPNPSTPSGRIKSVCTDSTGNFSTIASQDINIDWTAPICTTVNDGTGADVDTIVSPSNWTALSANWAASTDANSGISKYWYAIGTTHGGTDVVNWTDNSTNTAVTTAAIGAWNQPYYFSVKTVNGAGLTDTCFSDGIIILPTVGIDEIYDITGISIQPNPFSENTTLIFTLAKEQKIKIILTDAIGKEIIISDLLFSAGKHNIVIDSKELNLSRGVYTVKLLSEKNSSTVKFIKN